MKVLKQLKEYFIAAFNESAYKAAESSATIPNVIKEILEVGDRMKDGTVVIDVDAEKNIALIAPEIIFGGDSILGYRNFVKYNANRDALHGKKDWRSVEDEECSKLAMNWNKVAPSVLQGEAAPWFWGEGQSESENPHIFRGGKSGTWLDDYSWRNHHSRPVPIVRTVPARLGKGDLESKQAALGLKPKEAFAQSYL